MVAMGLRTGCGKEAVMVAALMAEDFCMLAGELSTSIDELRSVVVQTVLKPMKLISYETYTRLCSSMVVAKCGGSNDMEGKRNGNVVSQNRDCMYTCMS
jgi:hypothetical protein